MTQTNGLFAPLALRALSPQGENLLKNTAIGGVRKNRIIIWDPNHVIEVHDHRFLF